MLISSRTEQAYYEREEVAAALDLARRDPKAHRVVPVYLDAPDADARTIPYGLRLKHGLDASAPGRLGRIAEQLLATLNRLRGAPLTPERREASARALSRLTGGSTAERLSGLQ